LSLLYSIAGILAITMATAIPLPAQPHKIAFLLLPEFSNLGLAAAVEPLFVANWLAQKELYRWVVVSANGKSVLASNGMLAAVDGDLRAAETCSTIFVLASFEPARMTRNKPVTRWLKRIAQAGREIGGIENGTQALAEAGLLDKHPAAIHWDNLAGFQELYPRIATVPQPYSFSANRMTCAGASAILDMLVAWIERRADAQLAAEVAKHLLLTEAAGVEKDRGTPRRISGAKLDPLVATAQALMRDRLDDPMPCAQIATRVGLSLRQLERRFKHQCGRSVNQHYMLLRIEKAHQFLQQTDLSVTEVSVSCGFHSVEYFARVYGRIFGCRPSSDRRQSTDAPVFRPTLAKGNRR
jgi:AraC family transcriptional regulator, carnitine catabolism transcriptional activator